MLHVNGDDPEAVVHVMWLASAYRTRFHRCVCITWQAFLPFVAVTLFVWCSDILVDIWCYRRHGHNESDVGHITQPKVRNACCIACSCALAYFHILARGFGVDVRHHRPTSERL